MKRLEDFVKKQYISLKGLDKDIVERLSNLNGYAINECDCGCCCCDPYDCEATPCPPEPTISPAEVVQDPVTQAKSKFYGQPKVYDLLDAHTALDYRCRFADVVKNAFSEPIFFCDYCCPINGYDRSKKLRDDILTICKEFDLLWPVLMIKNDGSIQLFAAKKFGSNGEECSIKSSLIDAADILSKLEKRKEVEWAQVLDVSIDNLDDLYDFLFTVTFNKEKYDKELEDQKAKDMDVALKNAPTALPTY